MLSIFINVGSQQDIQRGKSSFHLALEGKSTAREPHIALPFSYILQNKFCPCECRSGITLINIFPCRYIPRGAVLANICPKIYILLFQVIFQDERCLWNFQWIYGKIENFLLKILQCCSSHDKTDLLSIILCKYQPLVAALVCHGM